jgi:hypothetical protein
MGQPDGQNRGTSRRLFRQAMRRLDLPPDHLAVDRLGGEEGDEEIGSAQLLFDPIRPIRADRYGLLVDEDVVLPTQRIEDL